MLNRWLAACATAVTALASGCAHSSPAQVTGGTPLETAKLAVPCPALSPADGRAAPDRIFLEVAEALKTDVSFRPLEQHLREHQVGIHILSGSVTGDQQTARLPWSSCFDQRCSKRAQWTLEVTPEFPTAPSSPVRFFVKLVPQDPAIGVGTTVETYDQHPVLVEMPLVSQVQYATAMVLTPYLLTGDEGMQSLLKCKLKTRDAARLSRAEGERSPDQK